MGGPLSMFDEAAHARIANHMNNHHKRELSHYLRHYSGLSARAASSPELIEISLTGMTITAGGSGGAKFRIPFEPPLSSPAEVRGRVVTMDTEARTALGIRDVYVTTYTPPRGFDIAVFGGVALYFLSYATLPHLLPGTPFWSALAAFFPGGPRAFRWLVTALFWPVLGIHVFEVWWMHRTRLLPHGVDTGSRLWWTWVGSTFFEGVCAFRRIDSIIADKTKEKEEKAAASH
ncbi:hypothetical protein SODALDRAFT_327635 [Sodiomyces alkalinus F11]|uniref:DUF2470 domain-containing protein n=1 Tax=Sodiomyces alkalinus (strain CBS 110278 / VKM F-3762 / F11) TaxID=1314773 RepID=A0A3N2Q9J7_SODAK|nr:hypothetical protein SODALDRAFT_327635 [Sodiomyces alkalinus F11]ROT43434.1 hypothetical protein SODALDRAFT_327635 [Sodiomyces alkalinus F11]